MEPLIPDFLHLRLLDLADIVLVAFIFYYVYNLIRGTIAVNIVLGFIIIYIAHLIVAQAQMRLLSEILGGFVRVGFLAVIVVFQPEIRRFLLLIGKNASIHKNKVWWTFFIRRKETNAETFSYLEPVIEACINMQKTRTGALIIFAKYFDEQYYRNTGEPMDALVSRRLIESIFQKSSPLHDGAVVISEGKIKVASCILPLTDNEKLPIQFGLRHRAGIGISEMSDSVAIIVSEETGEISYAKQGQVKMSVSKVQLQQFLVSEVV